MPFAPGQWMDFIVWEDVLSPPVPGNELLPTSVGEDYIVRLNLVSCGEALKRARVAEAIFEMKHMPR